MKFDLATSIIVGIIGVVVAFFVMNLFLPEIESFSFKVLSSTPTTTLTDPNPEVFNYRAINPTVEVYVGQCEEYDSDGNCLKKVTSSPNDTNNNSTNPESSNANQTPAEGE